MNNGTTDSAAAARRTGYRVLGGVLVGLLLGIAITVALFWAAPDTAARMNANGLQEQTVQRLSLRLSEDPETWLANWADSIGESAEAAKLQAGALGTRLKSKVTAWLDEATPAMRERLAEWGQLDEDGRFVPSPALSQRLRSIVEATSSGRVTIDDGISTWLSQQARIEYAGAQAQFTTNGRYLLAGVAILAVVCIGLLRRPRWRRPATAVLAVLGVSVLVGVLLMLYATLATWMIVALATPAVLVVVVMAPGEVGVIEMLCDMLQAMVDAVAQAIGGLFSGLAA